MIHGYIYFSRRYWQHLSPWWGLWSLTWPATARVTCIKAFQEMMGTEDWGVTWEFNWNDEMLVKPLHSPLIVIILTWLEIIHFFLHLLCGFLVSGTSKFGGSLVECAKVFPWCPFFRCRSRWPQGQLHVVKIPWLQQTKTRGRHKLVDLSFKRYQVIQLVTFLGWLSDSFKGLSDLQLGDEKVTLNHLVSVVFLNVFSCTKNKLPPWGFGHCNEEVFSLDFSWGRKHWDELRFCESLQALLCESLEMELLSEVGLEGHESSVKIGGFFIAKKNMQKFWWLKNGAWSKEDNQLPVFFCIQGVDKIVKSHPGCLRWVSESTTLWLLDSAYGTPHPICIYIYIHMHIYVCIHIMFPSLPTIPFMIHQKVAKGAIGWWFTQK